MTGRMLTNCIVNNHVQMVGNWLRIFDFMVLVWCNKLPAWSPWSLSVNWLPSPQDLFLIWLIPKTEQIIYISVSQFMSAKHSLRGSLQFELLNFVKLF